MSAINEGNEASPFYRTPWLHTAAPTDYDVVASGPGGRLCRQLTITDATGDVVVIGQDGTPVTLKLSTIQARPVFTIAVKNLVAAGSSACTLFIEW